jgi:hypothetical protein
LEVYSAVSERGNVTVLFCACFYVFLVVQLLLWLKQSHVGLEHRFYPLRVGGIPAKGLVKPLPFAATLPLVDT